MTQAWSLRETDLFMWQRKLDRIDDSRRDGNFFDAEGKPADLHAQRVSATLKLNPRMLTFADSSLSGQKRLCQHLPAAHRIRTSLRSPPTDIQPATYLTPLPGGSEEGRRCFKSPGAVPIQYEIEFNRQYESGWEVPGGQGHPRGARQCQRFVSGMLRPGL